jgi:hypothetical protein
MDGSFGNDVRVETVAEVNGVDVVATTRTGLAKDETRARWKVEQMTALEVKHHRGIAGPIKTQTRYRT